MLQYLEHFALFYNILACPKVTLVTIGEKALCTWLGAPKHTSQFQSWNINIQHLS